MVILTGLIVLAVPNFANLMALVGATCCTMIAFVLPAVFHMKIFKGYLCSIHKLRDVLALKQPYKIVNKIKHARAYIYFRALTKWQFSVDAFLIVLGIAG